MRSAARLLVVSILAAALALACGGGSRGGSGADAGPASDAGAEASGGLPSWEEACGSGIYAGDGCATGYPTCTEKIVGKLPCVPELTWDDITVVTPCPPPPPEGVGCPASAPRQGDTCCFAPAGDEAEGKWTLDPSCAGGG